MTESKRTESNRPEEKEWSEIRNEILKKVEDFTDQQIEKVRAAIHKKTEPKAEEAHADKALSERKRRWKSKAVVRLMTRHMAKSIILKVLDLPVRQAGASTLVLCF